MSSHTATIKNWFDLHQAEPLSATLSSHRVRQLLPGTGQITLLSGPSGAGKSRLLRTLAKRLDEQGITRLDPTATRPPERRAVVDCFGPDVPLTEALDLLGRVGLAEAWTYLRPAKKLSAGQQFRLALALTLAAARRSAPPCTLVIDEFAAVLDRVTACVVARALRRIVNAQGLAAIVATSHDDLGRALLPDVTVRCEFTHVRIDRSEGALRYA